MAPSTAPSAVSVYAGDGQCCARSCNEGSSAEEPEAFARSSATSLPARAAAACSGSAAERYASGRKEGGAGAPSGNVAGVPLTEPSTPESCDASR